MTVTDAVIDYVDWGICAICGMPHQTDIPKIWGRPTTCPVKRRPGVIGIRVFRICENCQHYDAAEVEAEKDGGRFTPIGTGIGEEGFNSARCHCGAVRHERLGYCIPCSKDIRMLDQKQREAKLLSQVLTELRREIKKQTKEHSTT